MTLPDAFDLDGRGDVRAFIDDHWSAVMVKVVDGTDPVELLPDEARRLAAALMRLADALDEHDTTT